MEAGQAGPGPSSAPLLAAPPSPPDVSDLARSTCRRRSVDLASSDSDGGGRCVRKRVAFDPIEMVRSPDQGNLDRSSDAVMIPAREGPAFRPDKRRRTGSKRRNSRPAFAAWTVPACAPPPTGPVPAEAARGRRLWVAPSQVVICVSCGFFSTGTAGHLLVDCLSGQHDHSLSDRAQRNRRQFLSGFHPADEGSWDSRRIPPPRPLVGTDPETHWVRLLTSQSFRMEEEVSEAREGHPACVPLPASLSLCFLPSLLFLPLPAPRPAILWVGVRRLPGSRG